jgi:hypothetical protein
MDTFLIDAFPEAVEIDGVEYELNTDFRIGIQIMMDFESDEWTEEEKAWLMLNRLYKNPESITNYEEALRLATQYLNAGKLPDEAPDTEYQLRLYSFSRDSRLIYAAFHQTHGIDLQTVNMHWWKFFSLFMDLGSETSFNSLIYARQSVIDGKATDDQKRFVEVHGGLFAESGTQYADMDEEELLFLSALPDGEGFRF